MDTQSSAPRCSKGLGNGRDALGVADPVDQRLDFAYQLNSLILERTVLDEEPNGVDSRKAPGGSPQPSPMTTWRGE